MSDATNPKAFSHLGGWIDRPGGDRVYDRSLFAMSFRTARWALPPSAPRTGSTPRLGAQMFPDLPRAKTEAVEKPARLTVPFHLAKGRLSENRRRPQ